MRPHEYANHALRDLWRDMFDVWPGSLGKFWPIQYPPFETDNCVLFVGVNPSFNPRDEETRKHADDLTLNAIEQLDSPEGTKIAIDLEARAKGRVNPSYRYEYFKPLPDLTPPRFTWDHIDVFAVREARQHKVKKALRLQDEWTPFANRQFEIFLETVRRINPVALVVINSFASNVLKKRLPHCRHDPRVGYYVATLGEGR